MIELIKLVRSPRKGKRFKATIRQDDNEYFVHFGDSTMKHYPNHKDNIRKKIGYIKRHIRNISDKKFDKITPGILSILIGWGFTDLERSKDTFNHQMKKLEKGIKIKTDPELYRKIYRELREKNHTWNPTLSKKLVTEYNKQFGELYGGPRSHGYIKLK